MRKRRPFEKAVLETEHKPKNILRLGWFAVMYAATDTLAREIHSPKPLYRPTALHPPVPTLRQPKDRSAALGETGCARAPVLRPTPCQLSRLPAAFVFVETASPIVGFSSLRFRARVFSLSVVSGDRPSTLDHRRFYYVLPT